MAAPGAHEVPGDPGAADGGALSYARAGVDIAAGDRAVDLIRDAVARATRPEVVGGIGGFAGLFDAYRRPLLATATDGVGTKVAIAQQLGVYGTVGIDLVAMVVDDLAVCGAEPLFLTDYVVCGRIRPERVAAIVAGVAEGCVQAGCALIGGETAEHPGHLGPDDFDLDHQAAPANVAHQIQPLRPIRKCWALQRKHALVEKPGAIGSSGLHSNGFSLVRRVLSRPGGAGRSLDLGATPPGLDRTLGEELLVPTRIYARDCLELAAGCDVHAFAHVTGGGLALNLARVLPPHADAVLDRATWSPQPIFGLLATHGSVAGQEMERVFNMGVGMVAVVGADDAGAAISLLASRAVPTWLLGEITEGTGTVRLSGRHPA